MGPAVKRGGRPPNILIILSDEHDPSVTSCYGHPAVHTPHLDRLASESTLFERAYCTGPLCVPSRLSLLTGKYPHQIGAWDNDAALDPAEETWGHHLGRAGYETVICGRTHFNGADRLHGFERRLMEDLPSWYSVAPSGPNRTSEGRRTRPHVALSGRLEDEPPGPQRRHDGYDTRVAALARGFIHEHASGTADRPWLLYCGMIYPHFPLLAPRKYLDQYDWRTVPLPAAWDEPIERQHPAIQRIRRALGNDLPLTEELVRRAIAAYWALVTAVDHEVGQILAALDASPSRENTVVIYASDHGEMAGQHGMWQKNCFYERSVRVPLLLRLPATVTAAAMDSSPDHSAYVRSNGGRVAEPVSLVDVLPTLLDFAGVAQEERPRDLPGRSLLESTECSTPQNKQRTVFAELHTGPGASFMVRRGAYKLCHYLGFEPQIFRPDDDPEELVDLSTNPAHAQARAELEEALRRIVAPERVDMRAKADQTRRREAHRSGTNG